MDKSKELVPTSSRKKDGVLVRKSALAAEGRHSSGPVDPVPTESPSGSSNNLDSLADVLRYFDGKKSTLSLRDAVCRSLAAGSRERITVEVVFTESGHPFEFVAAGRYDSRSSKIGDLWIQWLDDPDGDWFLAAWPSNYKDVFYLVSTVHATDRRWKRAIRWMNSARGVVRPFLNHQDFENIGTRLAMHGDVEVGRVSARSVLDGSSDSRGWKALEGHLRPSPADVILSMESQGFSVRTLMLHLKGRLSVHIRRMAGATFHSGYFDVFMDEVLDPLAAAAFERRSLLINRQRTRADSTHPVTIKLPSSQLEGSEATGDLIREISSLSKTTLAIFHRNPYLHIALSDEVDGSNFDVMVTESSSIDVYPGFKATPAALARLVDHLSDRFGGESVTERLDHSYSLDELSLG